MYHTLLPTSERKLQAERHQFKVQAIADVLNTVQPAKLQTTGCFFVFPRTSTKKGNGDPIFLQAFSKLLQCCHSSVPLPPYKVRQLVGNSKNS
jgi:hypothetical protein